MARYEYLNANLLEIIATESVKRAGRLPSQESGVLFDLLGAYAVLGHRHVPLIDCATEVALRSLKVSSY